jgi:hypothetical protein
VSGFTFTRPGNLIGSGFLIIYGGVPQFSIAWNATREPERITFENAIGEGLTIDGKPADHYEMVRDSYGDFMAFVPKTEVATEVAVEPVIDQKEEVVAEAAESSAVKKKASK